MNADGVSHVIGYNATNTSRKPTSKTNNTMDTTVVRGSEFNAWPFRGVLEKKKKKRKDYRALRHNETSCLYIAQGKRLCGLI
eukprot:m.483398 g.483398  ORF g.483398 m.483398 type:complete len:82 (+) comp22924_c0_seq1:39-284(+)